MAKRTALVVGGTGVTGPFVVNGLLKRGYEVTILHSGLHEVDFDEPVEHLHGDAHFPETLQALLGRRQFDVTVAMYGRLRHVAECLRGRTAQFVAMGGVFYEGWTRLQLGDKDPVAYAGLKIATCEEDATATRSESGLISKGLQSERFVIDLSNQGAFAGSVYRIPRIYGPRAPAGVEWGIVRRLLDGRRKIIVPDGGMVAETRAYASNVAHMLLLAVDRPDQAAGQVFNCGDERATTLREWILAIAEALDIRDVELVSVPYAAAFPAYPYARDPFVAGHRVLDLSKAKVLLGYRDAVPFAEAIARTAQWYAQNPFERGGEAEQQLGDAFDYDAEDALLGCMAQFSSAAARIPRRPYRFVHPYRHPVAQS
jgi:nucleoside-diphosphate-sugar epimerase